MIMRSAKVPLNRPRRRCRRCISAAAGVSATVFHLMPVGKPAPPRPRRPEATTSSTVASGPSSSALGEALIAAMRPVICEATRIDDAAAREGEPRLALSHGDILDQADARACALPSSMPPSNRPRRRRHGPGHSRRGPPASRPRPAARARTGRASRCARSRPRGRASRALCENAAATSSAPTRSAPASRGMKMRGVIACASFSSASSFASSSRPNTCLSSMRGGRRGAEPEAVDRLRA